MPKIALTFDDDPKVFYQNGVQLGTAELLRVIEELNANREDKIRVTFFVVGKNLEKMNLQDAKVLERMALGGHEIANHSYSHPYGFHRLSQAQVIEEVDRTHRLIQDFFGQEPTYFRPPHGLISLEGRQAIQQHFPNYRIVGWHRHDEKDSYVSHQLREVVVRNAQDHQVVLLHVWYQTTLWAMRNIFTDLRNRQYQLVTLRELNTPAIAAGLKAWD